ncbi:MAG: hypothetical protein AMXMBFR36_05250 [Acidobacteriota bacterium]
MDELHAERPDSGRDEDPDRLDGRCLRGVPGDRDFAGHRLGRLNEGGAGDKPEPEAHEDPP